MTPPEVYLGGDLSLTFEHSDRSNPVASSESNSDKDFLWKEITNYQCCRSNLLLSQPHDRLLHFGSIA